MQLEALSIYNPYWKDKGKVDFFSKKINNYLVVIYVTYTETIHLKKIKALVEFKEKHKK